MKSQFWKEILELKAQVKNNIRFLKIYMKINHSKEDQPMAQYKWSSTWYYYIDARSRLDWSSRSQKKSVHWNQWVSPKPLHTYSLSDPFCFHPHWESSPFHWTVQPPVFLIICVFSYPPRCFYLFIFLTRCTYGSDLHSERKPASNQ